jgi:hypothetical protein
MSQVYRRTSQIAPTGCGCFNVLDFYRLEEFKSR